MTWEDSLWVRNRGREYGSRFDEQYGSNTEAADGERLRNSCLYMFTMLERNLAKSNDSMSHALFKIAVEDVGINDNGKQEYWIYLLHT